MADVKKINGMDINDDTSRTNIGCTQDTYSNKKTYGKDDIVVYNNTIYKCITAVTKAEEFTAVKWQQICLRDLLIETRERNKYLETETRVGIWKNGQPLYRKVIENSLPATTADGTYILKDIDIGNNIGIVFIEFGYFVDNNSNRVSFPFITQKGYQTKCYISGYKKLVLSNGVQNYSDRGCIVSVLYTKTTN
jgi:hypothetical protein